MSSVFSAHHGTYACPALIKNNHASKLIKINIKKLIYLFLKKDDLKKLSNRKRFSVFLFDLLYLSYREKKLIDTGLNF